MQRPAKILVIRFSSIGDIVLTTPVLRALKTQLEGNTEVHFLTKNVYRPILEENPNVDVIHSIKDNVNEVNEILANENFDYVVDLHKNIRSAKVKAHLRKITFSFDKLNFKKFLLVAFGIDKLPQEHIVDRYLSTLKGFGVKPDERGLDFYIPDSDQVDLNDVPIDTSKGYVAWVIGAAHEGKRMPNSKVSKLVKSLSLPVILIGGKGDIQNGDDIQQEYPQGVWNACGKFSLNRSASLLHQSSMVVSGDTGMMHIAAALNKKVVSLWGCTSPKFGMYPYKAHPDSIILEPLHLTKRPCSKLGNHCKYGMETRCISQIPNEEIVSAIEKLSSLD